MLALVHPSNDLESRSDSRGHGNLSLVDVEPQVVQARRLDHSLCARRRPKVCMELVELSDDGVVCNSDVPMLVGELLSLAVPRHRGHGGWPAYGRVAGCDAAYDGYRVRVEFESLRAA